MGVRKWNIDNVRDEFAKCGYILLSEEYQNGSTRLLAICPNGHKIETNGRDFINGGKRCRKCYEQTIGDRCRKPFHELLCAYSSEGYEYISGEYKDKKSRLLFRCPKGHIVESTWSTFRNGGRCKICRSEESSERQRIPFENILNEIELRGYTFIGCEKYENSNDFVDVVCPNGHSVSIRIRTFMSGHGCKFCGYDSVSKHQRTAIEDVEKIVCVFGDSLVELKFKRSHARVVVVCGECGDIFESPLQTYKNGSRGCNCNFSIGEKRISEFLILHSIPFIPQKKFDGCRNIFKLPFDFYLPNQNLCIEFQGEGHYHPIPEFGGEKELKNRQLRDSIKRDFCKTNNISLLEIPYWERANVEQILSDYLFS